MTTDTLPSPETAITDEAAVQTYLQRMEDAGYNRKTAETFLRLHAPIREHICSRVDQLLWPKESPETTRKAAALDVLHYLPLLYTDASHSPTERIQVTERALEALVDPEQGVGEPNPVNVLRYALRYIDLWGEHIPLARQQQCLEVLIQRAGDGAGDILVKSIENLEKRFSNNKLFLNALRGHITRTASILNVQLLSGESSDFALADIDLQGAVQSGHVNQSFTCCKMAEGYFREALLAHDEHALIYVKGELVGLMKCSGENSMLALRNVLDKGEVVLKTGFAYELPYQDCESAQAAVDGREDRETEYGKYEPEELVVHELRKISGIDVLPQALKRYYDENACSGLSANQLKEQLHFLITTDDPCKETYMKREGRASSPRTMILTFEQALQNRIVNVRTHVEAAVKIQEWLRILDNNVKEVSQLESVLRNRSVVTRLGFLLLKLFKKHDFDAEHLERCRRYIPNYRTYLAQNQSVHQTTERLLKEDTLTPALTRLTDAGITLDQLDEEGDSEEERHPAMLEMRASEGTFWITFSSQADKGRPDRAFRLSFPQKADADRFVAFLQKNNPLLPLEDLLRTYDLMCTLSIEFPFVSQNGTLRPTPAFCRQFKQFLSQDAPLFTFEKLVETETQKRKKM